MKRKITLILCTAMNLVACTKVLDKQNLTAISPLAVWSDANVATAYVNNIYNQLMPGNPSWDGNNTDEAAPWTKQTNDWLLGTATYDSWDNFGRYNNIRTINIFLDNINNATFDASMKQNLKGEAFFWRAWCYYDIVKGYGGVPLILHAQAATSDLTSLQLPRNKTSECVKQIIADLDSAIANCNDYWSTSDLNFGRVDKGIGMAFKGRVLNFFSSPLFNGANGAATWQMAYDANLAAKNFLNAHGKGLYAPFSKIWNDELNKEQVFVRRFNYPQSTYFQGAEVPLDYSKDDVGSDHPSLELVNAFPMKDGSAWNPATMSYDTLFMHRDDRFYASIYFNGAPVQYVKGMSDANTYEWTYWNVITSYNGGLWSPVGVHNTITNEGTLPSTTSFYRMKAIDPNMTRNTVYQAAVDWPEIRYTEVLMNYGEAANETGRSSEALDVLYQVRQRAGILPGAGGKYGITANAKQDIRVAYQKERFVEFCFENKRWDDLRRWKMFDYLRGLTQRHGLAILLKPGQADVKPLDDIYSVWNKFTSTVVTVDRSSLVIPDQYYFYGIPKERLDRNPLLKQNINWGGDFDPLQ
ncbi:putative outer membrane starch-binding protein [Chitinophaga polysaccharea]|uniref:Putative outer membrane starch-binding protein n=1 Tax=Chitinophaga polysaccharea TaxID=1293035 RepID=A0A561Q5T6_9BACT|nr:RagB/SusD family nutrient uptake outer membrane protein [Chitinophaga polysaccharea]TWF45725.1 putative outer membrane starch-binding protein [Chitinophaga polysaccharea]